uniref:Putative secreted protein n=1 Tax=Ixodes ricinus TaxID=34613 RepID=A0A6B0UR94_IXORI
MSSLGRSAVTSAAISTSVNAAVVPENYDHTRSTTDNTEKEESVRQIQCVVDVATNYPGSGVRAPLRSNGALGVCVGSRKRPLRHRYLRGCCGKARRLSKERGLFGVAEFDISIFCPTPFEIKNKKCMRFSA